MSQRASTIESLPMAFEVVKAIQADEWGEGYRPLGRQAFEEIIEQQMANAVEAYLEQLEGDDVACRRNRYYLRHLVTELGDIELNVPQPALQPWVEVLRTYARPTAEIDQVILAGFVLGSSTRKAGEPLLALLGRPVSAATVSQVRYYLPGAPDATLVRKPSNIFVPSFHRRDTDC